MNPAYPDYRLVCAYCRTRFDRWKGNLTEDHVPPKGIFGKPKPPDLLWVPCCESCRTAGGDEEFKVLSGLGLRRDERGQNVLADLRRAKARGVDPWLRALRAAPAQDLTLATGEYAKAIQLPPDFRRKLMRSVERTARGLMFYDYPHFDNRAYSVEIVATNASQQDALETATIQLSEARFGRKIASEIFKYAWDFVPGDKAMAMWMQIHESEGFILFFTRFDDHVYRDLMF